MHWFGHFLTKLSKYLWIKTGDRHYHFVEPWVIDRPFCRMETLYRSHFVEKGVGSLQNGPPPTPPREWQGGSYIYIIFRGSLSVKTCFVNSVQSECVSRGHHCSVSSLQVSIVSSRPLAYWNERLKVSFMSRALMWADVP